MKTGLQQCHENRKNPIIFSAEAYQRFVTLHPFENGNGRTARMIMDYILQRFDILPPVMGDNVLDANFVLEPGTNKNFNPLIDTIIQGIGISLGYLKS